MNNNPLSFLFLCTGNSARSILAEAIFDAVASGLFKAFSAGSSPKGQIHPGAVALLKLTGHETSKLTSKSWNRFAAPDAPNIDCIITLCGSAANEVCPDWPGHPCQVHWGLPDPAAQSDPEKRDRCFRIVYDELKQRAAILEKQLPSPTVSPNLKASLSELAQRNDHLFEEYYT